MENQFITIFITFLIIASFYFIMKKIDSRYTAINIKRVICPKCKTKLPFFRFPKNLKQAFWGGHTCFKCGTELDKFGNIIG